MKEKEVVEENEEERRGSVNLVTFLATREGVFENSKMID